ncbi:MAG: hypothetical protein PHU85_20050 [Phycisphaerae bacterium]|nr:hypothetical protein [Phycisphaerae bacterium]
MNRLAFVAAVAAMLFLVVTVLHADDVTVKTIKPDPADPAGKPVAPADPAAQPAVAPKPPTAPSPFGPMPGSKWIDTGISRVSYALSQATPTDEQAEKIKTSVADIRRQITDQNRPGQEELTKLQEEMAQPKNRDKLAEMSKRWQELFRPMQERAEKFRPALEEKFLPLLTAAQVKKYSDAMDETSETPAGNAKRYARTMLFKYRGAELSEDQRAQMRDVYSKRLEEFYRTTGTADWAKKAQDLTLKAYSARQAGNTKEADALNAEYQKMSQPFNDALKAADKEAEQLLTAEQQAKLKAARAEESRRATDFAIDTVTVPLGELGLSDQQKDKSAELVDAARAAMADLGPDDWTKKHELGQQLKKDIAELLTPEQQAKLKKARITYTYDSKTKQTKPIVSFNDPG